VRAIDSSSLVKFFSKEPGWRDVRELILEGVVTLDLAVKEVANALWKKVLREEMKAQDAGKIITDLIEGDVIKLADQRNHIQKAFEIALNNKITVYDSLFIALAKKLHTELITSDSRQAEAAEKEGVRVREV